MNSSDLRLGQPLALTKQTQGTHRIDRPRGFLNCFHEGQGTIALTADHEDYAAQQQETCGVGACNQQNHAYGAHRHPQHFARVSDHVQLQWAKIRADASSIKDGGAEPIRRRYCTAGFQLAFGADRSPNATRQD